MTPETTYIPTYLAFFLVYLAPCPNIMVTQTKQPEAALTTLFYSSLPTTDGGKAYQHATGDRNRKNYNRIERLVSVENIRGREELASLDLTGFQYGNSRSTMSKEDFRDDEKVKSMYYREVEEALKKDTGAQRVVIFDHSTLHSFGGNSLTSINFLLSNSATRPHKTR